MFIFEGDSNTKLREKIDDAAGVIENIMRADYGAWFVRAMAAHGNLSYTNDDPEKVAQALVEHYFKKMIRVKLYRAKSSLTLAMHKASAPGVVYINSRKPSRTVPQLCGTLMHELCHDMDQARKDVDADHGGNSSKGKQNSAPYLAGAIFQTQAKVYMASKGLL